MNYEELPGGGSGSCGDIDIDVYFNYTYANPSVCELGDHHYNYSYTFYDKDGKKIDENNDSTTIPYYCVAESKCYNCGNSVVAYDYTLDVEKRDSVQVNYVAAFEHSQGITPKTRTVLTNPSGITSATYSATKNRDELSGQNFTGTINNMGLGASYSESWTYHGSGRVDEIEIGGNQSTPSTYTFYCSDYSDEQMDGMYLVANMYSSDSIYGGSYIGETSTCKSTIQFNSVTVTY